MKSLLTNIMKLNGSQGRELIHEGREVFAVPVVMLREMVLEGATGYHGPEYVPAGELESSAHLWNDTPFLVNHPFFASGRDPDVIDSTGLGRIYNAHYDKEKTALSGDAYVYVEQANRFEEGRETLSRLRNGDQIEVSTGYYADFVDEPGKFNGVEYVGSQTHIQPDHLAALPDDIGACSLGDGCGANRNSIMSNGKEIKDRAKVAELLTNARPPKPKTTIEKLTNIMKEDGLKPEQVVEAYKNSKDSHENGKTRKQRSGNMTTEEKRAKTIKALAAKLGIQEVLLENVDCAVFQAVNNKFDAIANTTAEEAIKAHPKYDALLAYEATAKTEAEEIAKDLVDNHKLPQEEVDKYDLATLKTLQASLKKGKEGDENLHNSKGNDGFVKVDPPKSNGILGMKKEG